MCENYRNSDTADWRQYHPVLRNVWHQQLTAYNPTSLHKSDQYPLYPEATAEPCHTPSKQIPISGPLPMNSIANVGQPIPIPNVGQ